VDCSHRSLGLLLKKEWQLQIDRIGVSNSQSKSRTYQQEPNENTGWQTGRGGYQFPAAIGVGIIQAKCVIEVVARDCGSVPT
jgi:hypothetical protein